MKIAVAIDGSTNALRAVEHAILLVSNIPEAELEFIHVIDFDKVKDEYLLSKSAEKVAQKRDEKIQRATQLVEQAGMEAKVTILKGKPEEEIIQYVNKENVQHLFVGSRGLNKIQELILGSVSDKVIHYANCPVTVVK